MKTELKRRIVAAVIEGEREELMAAMRLAKSAHFHLDYNGFHGTPLHFAVRCVRARAQSDGPRAAAPC